MIESLMDQLKEISQEEQEILNSKRPVLSHYSTVSNGDGEPILVTDAMVKVLKHPRFVDIPIHTHNCLEIVYAVSGSLRIAIEDATELNLEAGELLFLQPQARHATAAAQFHDIALHFLVLPEFLQFPFDMLVDDTVFRRFMKATLEGRAMDPPYLHFHLKDMVTAQNLLENLTYTLFTRQRNRQRSLRLTMAALMLELTQLTYKITVGTPNSYEQDLVLKALSYIENNYRTAALEDFCQSVNQPTYYISRLMKKYSPYTFTKYVQKRRLVQAVYLLTETAVPVEDIILQVGYENSSHFHRLFREAYGMSPKAYRKGYLERL